jgi:hypothetical protein
VKTKKNLFAATFLTILLVSLATPLITFPASASDDDCDCNLRLAYDDLRPSTWLKLESDSITVLFPRNATKPMFIWWYSSEPDQIYVVKYQGLIEYFAFNHPLLTTKAEYYSAIREAWECRFQEMYLKPEEQRWMGDISKFWLLNQIMMQIEEMWHNPYLPFDAGKWTLRDIANITAPDGKIIGVSFAFTLSDIWLPRFQFAENNIMIRVRFYNTTVEETDPDTGYKYTVNAGEMKMDLVVKNWKWNIDAIKQLILQLNDAGFDITLPEGKSKLALWVNLAAINITKLALIEDEPEAIEEHSTATYMNVEGTHEDIQENKTTIEQEKPIEISKPIIKIGFSNQTKTLGGFFRFVSSAKITGYPDADSVNLVPVKAAYISGGSHMRLFIGYSYFGNGTLEHDPSIGVDTSDTHSTPKYTVQTPSGMNSTPLVLGNYVPPLFNVQLMIALIAVVSATAIILYVVKWKRKKPVNMVGVSTTDQKGF